MKAFFSSLILLYLFLGSPGTVSGQSVSRVVSYKDFSLAGKSILLLTKSGKLELFNDLTASQGLTIQTATPVVAATIDREGTIVIGDTNHSVQTYNSRLKTWRALSTYTGKLTSIVFNSQNQCFLITDQGIVDAQTHTTYFPDSSFYTNRQIRYTRGWFYPPVSFLDHQDNIWLGFDHGEWGGDVFAFDTRQRAFRRLQTEQIEMPRNPVSGFCDDPQHVYMSGGVSHMFMTHGSISRFSDGLATSVLQAKDKETPVEVIMEDPRTGKKKKQQLITWKGGHQIGPMAYNPSTKCLYFYSQFGIFKGSPTADLADIKQWKNVLNPKLKWTAGSPYAAGPAMNVLKMQFTTDGTLLFLTEHNGLGIYAGKNLRFIE
ncbi:ligand-binding sensor domain-containing protein [Spirosoma fluviale]|uniref:Uncharacterized protein n=1 Tax=Spirosoma fluviale TaxID=1597977 RepID=A0A286F6M7_9BACT|nr:hypothetical protein [Spirosoma fluviale]SOD78887.1 hypothetical protein SAMN06269250_0691 [Spirosoma fluviale]